MEASTQDKAIEGLIALWEDIYFVQGKERVASRLKPSIQGTLKKVGPLFFSLAEGFAKYNDYPLELRRDLIRKGYEFSSKSGVSIGSFYGQDADTKKKRWSRIKQKIQKRQIKG